MKIPAEEQVKLPVEELKAELTHYFNTVIPKAFRPFSLNTIQPNEASRLPLKEQAALYEEMKAHPLEGWALFSPAGYGKTVCSYVLFKQALIVNMLKWAEDDHCRPWGKDYKESSGVYGDNVVTPRIYVWRKSVPDLLAQHFAMFNGKDVEPDITVEKIEAGVKRGYTPRVFFEEIDKIKASDFSINELFRIVDALDRHEGQLVLDTNMSKVQFVDAFGEQIARRVKKNCRVKEFGFQGGTK